MALLTILMALLTGAGLVSGVILTLSDDWRPVLDGAILALAALAALAVATLAGAGLDTLAGRLRRRRGPIAPVLAALGSIVPVGAMMIGNVATARQFAAMAGGHHLLTLLWSYAVATGPSTLVARAATARHRTLWGLRTYAGHVAAMALLVGAALPGSALFVATLLVIGWSVIPVVMGCVMALADPASIRDVRI